MFAAMVEFVSSTALAAAWLISLEPCAKEFTISPVVAGSSASIVSAFPLTVSAASVDVSAAAASCAAGSCSGGGCCKSCWYC